MMPPDPAQTAETARLQKLVESERGARYEAEAAVARLHRDLSDSQRGLELLQTISIASNQATMLEQAMQIALDQIVAHTGWTLGHVYLGAEDGTLDFVPLDVWCGPEDERYAGFHAAVQGARLPSRVGLPGKIFGTGKPAWTRDISADDKFPFGAFLKKLGLNAAFAFPLLIGPGVVGVLEFFCEHAEEPDPRLLKIMTHIGAQLGRAIERQRAQDSLQRRETYFRRLTESSLDLITILGPDGVIRYESSSIEQTLGYKPSEYTGKNAFSFVHPEDIPTSRRRSWRRCKRTVTRRCSTFDSGIKTGRIARWRASAIT